MANFFSDRARHPRGEPIFWALLVMTIGAVIIGGRSFATDEGFSWGLVTQPDFDATWDGIEYVSGNMAVYLAVLKGFAAVSQDEVWLRIPSLLAASGAVGLLYLTGRRWFGPQVGRIAAVLATTSVPLLYYAIEARSYAFVALFATATWYWLERAITSDRQRDWWLLGLAAGLMVSAHVINALVLPVVAAIVVVMASGTLVGRVLRLVPIGIFVAPSMLLILLGDGSQTDWIPGLGPATLGRAARFLAGDHAQFTHDFTGFALVAIYLTLFASAGWQTVANRQWTERAAQLAWLWFLGLPIMVTLVSVVEPLLWHRYLIGALPGAILVVARFLAEVDNRRLAAGLVVAIALLGTVRTLALRNHSADEYESLAAAIEQRAEPGDALAVATQWTRVGLDYYWREGAPVTGSPPFTSTFDHRATDQGLDWAVGAPRVWIVDRADPGQVWVDMDRPESDFDFESIGEPAGYRLVDEFDVQRFRVRLYEPEPTQ